MFKSKLIHITYILRYSNYEDKSNSFMRIISILKIYVSIIYYLTSDLQYIQLLSWSPSFRPFESSIFTVSDEFMLCEIFYIAFSTYFQCFYSPPSYLIFYTILNRYFQSFLDVLLSHKYYKASILSFSFIILAL